MEWFYAKNDEKKGPVSGSQLRSMVVSGEVAGDDLVWCEGMGDWIPAREVRDFDTPDLGAANPAEASPPSPSPATVVTPVTRPESVSPRLSEEWFYAKNNEKKGPVSRSHLKSMVVSGEVAGVDLVWREGMKGWIPASEVREFNTPDHGGANPAEASSSSPSPANVVTPATAVEVISSLPSEPKKVPTNPKAIVSLVCGCVGLVSCCLFGIPSLVAVIFGHLAKAEIEAAGGQQEGGQMAVAGLVTGYAGLGLTLIALLSGFFG